MSLVGANVVGKISQVFPRRISTPKLWAKCVGKLWANLGQEMLYDGDISGDDEYTLETLQAAAVEILGSPSGKDEDFNYLLEIMDQQFEDSNPGAARRPQLLLAPLSVSVWLAAFDPDLFEPCLRDVYSKHTAKVAGASLKAAEGILDAAEGEAATGAEMRAGAITSCGAKRVRRYTPRRRRNVFANHKLQPRRRRQQHSRQPRDMQYCRQPTSRCKQPD